MDTVIGIGVVVVFILCGVAIGWLLFSPGPWGDGSKYGE